jgi:site-specific recombinase XerD
MTRANITVRKARRDFLDSKRRNLKDSTVRSYKSITKDFINYCESEGIEAASEVDGYLLEQWKIKRQTDDEVSPATLKNNVKHIRVFIRWLESTELADQGLADKMKVPSVTEEEMRSQEIVDPEQMESILNHLELYEYASRQHAFLKLLWHIGARISAIVALDVQDFEPRKGVLKIRNRKDAGTALKNGNKSERNVTLKDDVVDVLNDYVHGRRLNATDDHGREPLFTTEHGRMGRQRAYKNFVGISRPCVYENECPHNRTIENCEAAQKKKKAYDCPSSGALHPVRRGSITHHLNQGWPIEQVSQRCDVSVEVLKKHYDSRTLEDTRQQRSQHLDKL